MPLHFNIKEIKLIFMVILHIPLLSFRTSTFLPNIKTILAAGLEISGH